MWAFSPVAALYSFHISSFNKPRSDLSKARPLAVLLMSLPALLGQTFTISTFAGGGPPDNVPATSIAVNGPVAVDSAGNAFFAVGYSVFRRDRTTGNVTQVAGNGVRGF